MGTLLKYPLLDLKENNLKNAVKKPKPINHYNSSLFVKNPTPVIKLPTKNTENKNEIKELINPYKESNDQRNIAINNNITIIFWKCLGKIFIFFQIQRGCCQRTKISFVG